MTPAEQVAELVAMTPAEHLERSFVYAVNASDYSIGRPNGRVDALAYAALHARWAAVKAAEVTYRAGEDARVDEGGITVASPGTMSKVLRVGDSWTYGRTRLTYGPPGVVHVEHLDGEDPGVVLS